MHITRSITFFFFFTAVCISVLCAQWTNLLNHFQTCISSCPGVLEFFTLTHEILRHKETFGSGVGALVSAVAAAEQPTMSGAISASMTTTEPNILSKSEESHHSNPDELDQDTTPCDMPRLVKHNKLLGNIYALGGAMEPAVLGNHPIGSGDLGLLKGHPHYVTDTVNGTRDTLCGHDDRDRIFCGAQSCVSTLR